MGKSGMIPLYSTFLYADLLLKKKKSLRSDLDLYCGEQDLKKELRKAYEFGLFYIFTGLPC